MSAESMKQFLIDQYERGERDFRGLGDRLKNANLSSITLEQCDLSGLDLSGANLSRANLRGVNLQGSNLSFANFVSAKLTQTDLQQTDLTFATLSNAEMISCQLSGADLSNARLSNADIQSPEFEDVVYNANTRFPDGFDPEQYTDASPIQPHQPSVEISTEQKSPSPVTEQPAAPKKKRMMFRGRWVDM